MCINYIYTYIYAYIYTHTQKQLMPTTLIYLKITGQSLLSSTCIFASLEYETFCNYKSNAPICKSILKDIIGLIISMILPISF